MIFRTLDNGLESRYIDSTLDRFSTCSPRPLCLPLLPPHWTGFCLLTRTNNLPIHLTHFIGREREVQMLTRLLLGPSAASCGAANTRESIPQRLVTLTGPGGCGKTRLAVQAASAVVQAGVSDASPFPDGVYFISLASASKQASMDRIIGATLARHMPLPRPDSKRLPELLESREILLVLDNCEHLADACAQLVGRLLGNCPGVVVMATSRTLLNIPGELSLPVPPLTTKQPAGTTPAETPHHDPPCEAVSLFVDRARTFRPEFALDDDNAPVIQRICHRLDGLPLAIELAAAHIKMMTPPQIDRRLRDVFGLLHAPQSTTLPHHQSLYATFEWSHQLLNLAEQILFRRLAVFVDGWTLDAAEQVACDSNLLAAKEVLAIHRKLLDQSFIMRADDGSGARARFRMLDTIHQFALEKLEKSGEERVMRDRHLQWCSAFTEEAEHAVLYADPVSELRRLDDEHANLQDALNWARETKAWEAGLRLAGNLWPFWEMRGYLGEGRYWLEMMLERQGSGAALRQSSSACAARMKAKMAVGIACWQQDDYELACAHLAEAIKLAEASHAPWYHAYSLCRRGRVLRAMGRIQEARSHYAESLRSFQLLNDRWGISRPLRDLAILARDEGDYVGAARYLEETLQLRRREHDTDGIADALDALGNVHLQTGQTSEANTELIEALQLFEELGYRQGAANSQRHLGFLALTRKEYALADSYFRRSLRLSHQLGAISCATDALIGMQAVCIAEHDDVQAARLEGLIEAHTVGHDLAVTVLYQDWRRSSQTLLATRLVPEQLKALVHQGRLTEVKRVLEHTLNPASSRRKKVDPDLTPREAEILDLAALGLTNREIATRLIISPRTVHAHMRSIFAKLEVKNRTAAVRKGRSLKQT